MPAKDLWKVQYMHENEAVGLWDQFTIIRKSPEKLLALRRIVYDNEHQAKDLAKPMFRRWQGIEDDGAWQTEDARVYRIAARPNARGPAWLRYRHLIAGPLRGSKPPTWEPITDLMSYNSGIDMPRGQRMPPPGQEGALAPPAAHAQDNTREIRSGRNFVGDLILETEVTVDDPKGVLWLELARGAHSYQARWDLASGICTLVRVRVDASFEKAVGDEGLGRLNRRYQQEEELKRSDPTALKGTGTHKLRFANVDDRLTVWVDEQPVWPQGVDYDFPMKDSRAPWANDLEPAGIGVQQAAVRVGELRLWRDTYYTVTPQGPDYPVDVQWENPDSLFGPDGMFKIDGAPKEKRTLYVQPGHYLCLGDNSTASSDSREWGLVPERLMLGRALLIYYPFSRAGRIR